MDTIFRILKEVDVVQHGDERPPELSVADPVFLPARDISNPKDTAGQLGSSLDRLDDVEDPVPSSQPSLFRKALALALVDKLSAAPDLCDAGQAYFLAEPDQAGVPAGKAYPKEVTNYQTFVKTDVMQTLNHAAYSLDGDSYYEYLAMYLRHVVTNNDPAKLAKARSDLIDAKRDKDAAYENARLRYQSGGLGSSLVEVSFIEALSSDSDYLAQWKKEQTCEATYTRLQGDSMIDFSRQLDQIKSADDRLVPREHNNMPCIAISDDYIHNDKALNGEDLQVSHNDIYYRPFCNLPDFATICNDWQNLNTNEATKKRYGPLRISLLDAQDQSWTELGHPDLDAAIKQKLTNEQRQVLQSLQISITFVGTPAIVDVDRGFWDVANFRKKFPHVAKDSPKALQRKVCKTIKMMFAWGIEIAIKLPAGTGVVHTSSNELDSLNLTFLKLGLVPETTKPDELLFTSGSTPYPRLIAVLAKVI